MNIKTILCPIDYSEFSDAANEYASVMAKANDAKIVFLHISQPEIPYPSYECVNLEREEKEEMARIKKIRPSVDEVKAEYAVDFGLPSERIVEYANENDIDLIVIGTHGRTGIRRVLMGSVAEAVVRKAECPVLAIKISSKVPQEN